MHIFKLDICVVVRLAKALVKKLGLKTGGQLNLIAATNGRFVVETQENQREAALKRMAARSWTLLPDHKFDRGEADER